MKLLIISLITLSSCTKTWNCTITTTSPYLSGVYYTEFEGTKEEAEEYEQLGTVDLFDVTQTTECK